MSGANGRRGDGPADAILARPSWGTVPASPHLSSAGRAHRSVDLGVPSALAIRPACAPANATRTVHAVAAGHRAGHPPR